MIPKKLKLSALTAFTQRKGSLLEKAMITFYVNFPTLFDPIILERSIGGQIVNHLNLIIRTFSSCSLHLTLLPASKKRYIYQISHIKIDCKICTKKITPKYIRNKSVLRNAKKKKGERKKRKCPSSQVHNTASIRTLSQRLAVTVVVPPEDVTEVQVAEDEDAEDVEDEEEDSEEDDVEEDPEEEAVVVPLVGTPIGPVSVVIDEADEVAEA